MSQISRRTLAPVAMMRWSQVTWCCRGPGASASSDLPLMSTDVTRVFSLTSMPVRQSNGKCFTTEGKERLALRGLDLHDEPAAFEDHMLPPAATCPWFTPTSHAV